MVWHYFDSKGRMVMNQVDRKIGSSYYTFENGILQTGWYKLPSVVAENTEAAAPKTADEDTGASSSNVGWSLTPPTQEDGLKKWQEQNHDAEVSFGN